MSKFVVPNYAISKVYFVGLRMRSEAGIKQNVDWDDLRMSVYEMSHLPTDATAGLCYAYGLIDNLLLRGDIFF